MSADQRVCRWPPEHAPQEGNPASQSKSRDFPTLIPHGVSCEDPLKPEPIRYTPQTIPFARSTQTTGHTMNNTPAPQPIALPPTSHNPAPPRPVSMLGKLKAASELEVENDRLRASNCALNSTCATLESQLAAQSALIAKLREALEFYAARTHELMVTDYNDADEDGAFGLMAREALDAARQQQEGGK